MNNNVMGGITFADYLFPDELDVFAVVNHKIIIRLKSGREWRELPITYMNVNPEVLPEQNDAGDTYSHSIDMNLNRSKLNDTQIRNLRYISTKGAIIRYTNTFGNTFVMGSRDYPLFGNLQELPGQNPLDFSGFKLSLSNKLTHPQLPVQEI